MGNTQATQSQRMLQKSIDYQYPVCVLYHESKDTAEKNGKRFFTK